MVEDGRRGKFRNACEIVVVQKIAGIQAAAPQEGVLDAGGHQLTETHLQIEIVQPLQQTALRVIGKVAQMVAVDLAHSVVRKVHKLIGNTVFLGRAVATLQSGNHSGVMIFAQLPQPRLPRALHGAGVRNVKNIFQMWPAAAVLPNQRNAGRASPYPAPHCTVPQFHTGAGGRVGALGVDQELFVKGIFVEAGGRVKVLLPATGTPRNIVGGLSGQFRYQPQFVRHIVPPFT